MLSAVIFDFDGIIVDTEPLHYRAFQRVLEPLGLGYGWDDYVSRYMGFDDRDAFREAFHEKGKDLPAGRLEELISAKAEEFQRIIAGGVTPYPGAVQLIRAVSGTLPLALCSGALHSDIVPILAQLGLSDAFDAIVTASDVSASKPDPESYLLALRLLREAFPEKSIDSRHSLAIEDTPAGILSAAGAGMNVLAVTNSYPAENLASAWKIVPSLAEVTVESLRSLA
jgi:beta-phosphoglucomutase